MYTFSPALITLIINYYKQTYNKDLSEDEAILYLDSLAGLFEAYQQVLNRQQSVPPETDQDK